MAATFLLVYASLDDAQAASIGADLHAIQGARPFAPATTAALERWRTGALPLPAADPAATEAFARGFHEPWPELRRVDGRAVRATDPPTFASRLLCDPGFDITAAETTVHMSRGQPALALLATVLGPVRFAALPFAPWGFLRAPDTLPELATTTERALRVSATERQAFSMRAAAWDALYHEPEDLDALLDALPTAIARARGADRWLLGVSLPMI